MLIKSEDCWNSVRGRQGVAQVNSINLEENYGEDKASRVGAEIR